jgi:hypothetical protein
MARRSKKSLRLAVRVSHETTRRSTVWLAAAFESVVPIVQRPPSRCGDVGAAIPKIAQFVLRR